MATLNDPYFSDMPCGVNDPCGGAAKDKFIDLQSSLVQIFPSPSINLIKGYLSTYNSLYRSLSAVERELFPPNLGIFDQRRKKFGRNDHDSSSLTFAIQVRSLSSNLRVSST
jgi:hypothetical protein